MSDMSDMCEEAWEYYVSDGKFRFNILCALSGDAARDLWRDSEQDWVLCKEIDRDLTDSIWEETTSMVKYGWRLVKTLDAESQIVVDDDTDSKMGFDKIKSCLMHYGGSQAYEDWSSESVIHACTWTDANDENHQPTEGLFRCLMPRCSSNKTIVAWIALSSPSNEAKRRKIRTTVPPLHYASDLLYLSYKNKMLTQQLDQSLEDFSLPAPDTIIVCDIYEDETSNVLDSIMKGKGNHLWPGECLPKDTDDFFALLGSRYGGILMYFLAQRKHIFGLKIVAQIRVWSWVKSEESRWNLAFEIGDV